MKLGDEAFCVTTPAGVELLTESAMRPRVTHAPTCDPSKFIGSTAWDEWNSLFMPVAVVSGLNKCFFTSLQKNSCNSLHGICLERGQSQPMQWLLVSGFPSVQGSLVSMTRAETASK